MSELVLSALRTLNEYLTAGIAITALSLLFYALSFNLRDRVARSFALVLICVVIVFVGDALSGTSSNSGQLRFWMLVQWPGIIFLPPTYLHLSDAVLATTGRPSRGRRRLAVRLVYIISIIFLVTLPWWIGDLAETPPPHLERTLVSGIFTIYYAVVMIVAWLNFYRAFKRSPTSAGRRRMGYLITGALAPALGCYPYLLYGSRVASSSPLFFWFVVTLSNLFITLLLVLMAYAVAFFGVSWPDRVVKRRLFKWLMRGPVTASTALILASLARRLSLAIGLDPAITVPIVIAGTILILEHMITLAAPIWERWLFYGRDRSQVEMLQTLEERLLTSSDLQQFLESILVAVCDRLQSSQAFIAVLGSSTVEMFITIGGDRLFDKDNLSVELVEIVEKNGIKELFYWNDYLLAPIEDQESGEANGGMLGLLGVLRQRADSLDHEQSEALSILTGRAALALRDRRRQQQVFSSLETLNPSMSMIQRLRAAARYDGVDVLAQAEVDIEEQTISQWVKDALTHYWGGPKLTQSPLIDLQVVQQNIKENQETPTNALRSVLRQAIDQTRPEGDRRFTGEWLLYNLLEMKFMEGRKVREIAKRLAMSEADLYRKQRVAIEAVASTILVMEKQARQDQSTMAGTKPPI
jgi:hypothetical protein